MKADGAVVQLGERFPRTEEVGGSNPLCSTIRETLAHLIIDYKMYTIEYKT